MRPEQISDALNQLDNDLIRETEQVRRLAKRRKKQPKVNWQLMGTLAACICLLVIGNVVVSKFVESPVNPGQSTEGTENSGEGTSENEPTTTAPMPDLPSLQIDGSMGNMGSGGGTHIVVADLDDWISTPWTESTTPERLPVYDNYKYNEYLVPYGFTEEDMKNWVYFIVDALGTELISMQLNYTKSRDDVIIDIDMKSVTDIADIRIDGKGNIRIMFSNLDLPEEYRMPGGLSAEGTQLVLDRLINRFEKLLNYSQPEKAVERRYDYVGKENHFYRVYDGAGDEMEDLLNYSYNNAEFKFDENGTLQEIYLRNGLSCAEKLEDYPVISAEEARQLLLAGHYYSEGSWDFTVEEKNIAAVELIYPKSNQPQIIIPYYCFYVELPGETLDGVDEEINEIVTHYRACYVPAIDSRYIENMPYYGGLSQ